MAKKKNTETGIQDFLSGLADWFSQFQQTEDPNAWKQETPQAYSDSRPGYSFQGTGSEMPPQGGPLRNGVGFGVNTPLNAAPFMTGLANQQGEQTVAPPTLNQTPAFDATSTGLTDANGLPMSPSGIGVGPALQINQTGLVGSGNMPMNVNPGAYGGVSPDQGFNPFEMIGRAVADFLGQKPKGQTKGEQTRKPDNQDKSWDSLVQKAIPIAQKYDIPVPVMLGQMALETGYGKSERAKDQNNYFGYMVYDDNAPGRSYNSPEESMEDYAKLISQDPRYANAYSQRSNPDAMIRAIREAGYATDVDYVQKVMGTDSYKKYRNK